MRGGCSPVDPLTHWTPGPSIWTLRGGLYFEPPQEWLTVRTLVPMLSEEKASKGGGPLLGRSFQPGRDGPPFGPWPSQGPLFYSEGGFYASSLCVFWFAPSSGSASALLHWDPLCVPQVSAHLSCEFSMSP